MATMRFSEGDKLYLAAGREMRFLISQDYKVLNIPSRVIAKILKV